LPPSGFFPQHGERRKTSKSLKDKSFSQTWWYIPIIPELRSLRQEDQEFKANQRPYLKKKKHQQKLRSQQLPAIYI
jgi:hypothetical protein